MAAIVAIDLPAEYSPAPTQAGFFIAYCSVHHQHKQGIFSSSNQSPDAASSLSGACGRCIGGLGESLSLSLASSDVGLCLKPPRLDYQNGNACNYIVLISINARQFLVDSPSPPCRNDFD